MEWIKLEFYYLKANINEFFLAELNGIHLTLHVDISGRTVKPYILDLESANGTYVNNRRIEARRYVELFEKDVVKFGYSSREYVLLHEASKGSDEEIPDVDTDLSPVSLLRNN